MVRSEIDVKTQQARTQLKLFYVGENRDGVPAKGPLMASLPRLVGLAEDLFVGS